MSGLNALGYPNRVRQYRPTDTCPVGACPHPIVFHDVDEVPWPRIERCTVTDCGCSGLVETKETAA